MEALRTLIVDDSSVMRKIVERALRQAGLSIGEVMEAGNGSRRWRLFVTRRLIWCSAISTCR